MSCSVCCDQHAGHTPLQLVPGSYMRSQGLSCCSAATGECCCWLGLVKWFHLCCTAQGGRARLSHSDIQTNKPKQSGPAASRTVPQPRCLLPPLLLLGPGSWLPAAALPSAAPASCCPFAAAPAAAAASPMRSGLLSLAMQWHSSMAFVEARACAVDSTSCRVQGSKAGGVRGVQGVHPMCCQCPVNLL